MQSRSILAIPALLSLIAPNLQAAPSLDEIAAKLDALLAENAQLRERVAQLENAQHQTAAAVQQAQASIDTVSEAAQSADVVRTNHDYAYAILDPTTNINRKQKYLLEQRKSGAIAADSVMLSGAVTPILDFQKSNTSDKFGYLMRHPTAANQRTKTVSEAVIHSAQFAITATVGDWTTAYMELLYDPEQSFGTGTLTDLNRNQIQLRRGYVLLGNLNETPYYAAVGKMSTPFGLTDTVNPFTASSVWHAFGGLAYGLNVGYDGDVWDWNIMAIQGGAQFRAHNTPVDNSNVPSKLNNFALDIKRTVRIDNDTELMAGASYTQGSAYCQDFPVTHFSACTSSNPAYDIYAQFVRGDLTLQAEYAHTLKIWPGTFNSTIPEYSASKVTSFGVGGKYRTLLFDVPTDLSMEFSRFSAGPEGSPWENQDQFVLGSAAFINPNTKLFAEYIRTQGYSPLNFISGGNLGAGVTHSDRNAHSDILMFGANAAF